MRTSLVALGGIFCFFTATTVMAADPNEKPAESSPAVKKEEPAPSAAAPAPEPAESAPESAPVAKSFQEDAKPVEDQGPKLLAKPFDLYAGLSLGVTSLNATDLLNGGTAGLGGYTSGLRIGAVRTLEKVEHRLELEARIISYVPFTSTRLVDVSQKLFPGLNWQMKFVKSNEPINWLVGVNINSVPYYSTLAVTTVKVDGPISLMPYGGARYYFRVPRLKYVDAHVGLDLPLGASAYKASLGLWQRVRIVGEKEWGESGNRWLEAWIDFTHSGETTNLETQDQMSIAAWVFAKWRFNP